ncbi:MAG: rhomboid family intramembrane serine protease [Bacteroidota bacterium]
MAVKLRYNAPVVLTFAVICTVVFFVNKSMGGALTGWFSLSPHYNMGNLGDLPTILTYVIGHANMDHLLGNLTFILLLGPIMEEKYGSRSLLIMMVLTALITGILNLVFFNTGILGASGIVFMFIILVSFTNVRAGEIPLTFILVMLLFLGKEVLHSLDNDQISQFGHILGGICGSAFGFFFGSSTGRDTMVEA